MIRGRLWTIIRKVWFDIRTTVSLFSNLRLLQSRLAVKSERFAKRFDLTGTHFSVAIIIYALTSAFGRIHLMWRYLLISHRQVTEIMSIFLFVYRNAWNSGYVLNSDLDNRFTLHFHFKHTPCLESVKKPTLWQLFSSHSYAIHHTLTFILKQTSITRRAINCATN